jgi:hypothetical protein
MAPAHLSSYARSTANGSVPECLQSIVAVHLRLCLFAAFRS